jgi:serine/threonine-protein phosphatase 2A activator
MYPLTYRNALTLYPHPFDVHKNLTALHASLTGFPEEATPEVSVYFKEAWGNRSRIDYGSGMELNFLCWL